MIHYFRAQTLVHRDALDLAALEVAIAKMKLVINLKHPRDGKLQRIVIHKKVPIARGRIDPLSRAAATAPHSTRSL